MIKRPSDWNQYYIAAREKARQHKSWQDLEAWWKSEEFHALWPWVIGTAVNGKSLWRLKLDKFVKRLKEFFRR